MREPLDIVIVGGGTAGWMCAAALSSTVDPALYRISLVESDEILTVGVGEATLPQMKDFNDYIGIIEADMMSKTNATFKLGIEFINWGFQNSSYIHPFGVHGKPIGGVEFHNQWVRANLAGYSNNVEDFSYAITACRHKKFDFPTNDPESINATYSYAYHFDALLYARYLRQFSEKLGLTRIEGKIIDVKCHPESGDITTLHLESGQMITGDLFIDCSGFRGLLIEQALQTGWEDWSHWLPCDRAIAVPCERTKELLPYTQSIACDAGWQWRIPLQNRIGNGYVFCSEFMNADEATTSILDTLEGPALAEPKVISFKAGRRLKSWNKNCITLGLSSGFLEPLESTSIYLIQIAIMNLLQLLPRKNIDPALSTEFNRRVGDEYERVRDFLILHYHANTKGGKGLWEYCQNMEIPDSLSHRMAEFKHRGYLRKQVEGLFSPPSWLAVYLGQGIIPTHYDRLANNMPLKDAIAEMKNLQSSIIERVQTMPDHIDFLADYCPSIDQAGSSS